MPPVRFHSTKNIGGCISDRPRGQSDRTPVRIITHDIAPHSLARALEAPRAEAVFLSVRALIYDVRPPRIRILVPVVLYSDTTQAAVCSPGETVLGQVVHPYLEELT